MAASTSRTTGTDDDDEMGAARVDLEGLQARLTALRSQDRQLETEARALQRRIDTLRAATRPRAPGLSRHGLFVVGFAIASPIGWMLGRLFGG